MIDVSDWVPWLLILLVAPEGTPHEHRVEKVQIVADEEDCHAQGAAYILAQDSADADARESNSFLCTAMPDRGAFNDAISRWMEKQVNTLRPE